MPFHLLCRRKCQTCFSFAMGCVKPWFKHPECNISNTSEGTEIRAYLGGCIVYCDEVDLNSVGASQEKPQSICKSYQCRTDSCVAFWSREAELSQSHSSISFSLLLLSKSSQNPTQRWATRLNKKSCSHNLNGYSPHGRSISAAAMSDSNMGKHESPQKNRRTITATLILLL